MRFLYTRKDRVLSFARDDPPAMLESGGGRPRGVIRTLPVHGDALFREHASLECLFNHVRWNSKLHAV